MSLRPNSRTEVHRNRYKVAVDAEEGRRRREDNMVEIRKSRREESLQKKRREALCTGLLLARRVLKMLEMDEEYEGNVEATGEDFSVEPGESRRPFCALLDVGLLRTTTGNRYLVLLKDALDDGLDIPHSDNSFAGFSKDNKQLDAEVTSMGGMLVTTRGPHQQSVQHLFLDAHEVWKK